jgi:hypothetical protein
MSETAIFGPCLEGVQYVDRPAAYVVIAGENDTVGVVKGTSDMIFLPGSRRRSRRRSPHGRRP